LIRYLLAGGAIAEKPMFVRDKEFQIARDALAWKIHFGVP
jgi:hypothetical protein